LFILDHNFWTRNARKSIKGSWIFEKKHRNACGKIGDFWDAKIGDFWEKNTERHVALWENFSGPVSTTDLVNGSKDVASLVACTQWNIFWLEDVDFLWVTS